MDQTHQNDLNLTDQLFFANGDPDSIFGACEPKIRCIGLKAGSAAAIGR